MLPVKTPTQVPIDLDEIRDQFPSLAATDEGHPRIHFDNPAGTQVTTRVVDRMSNCLLHGNANIGGQFKTSQLAGAIVDDARSAMADFVNAPSSDEIIFGQNMTTITLHLSRSIGRHLNAGDEIILSQMDHDANIEPWVLLARDLDLKIRWLPFDIETYEFDLGKLEELIGSKTRLICVGGASNLTGTINDVESICSMARDAGVWSFIDAVQSAPHVTTDVQHIGCDFLVCSAYKFFGPHQGILWGRRAVLEQLDPYKVRPAPAELPWCFETGTQSHEGLAGTGAAVDYFAWVGETLAGEAIAAADGESARRRHVRAGLDFLFVHEMVLAAKLVDGLQSIAGIKVQGITADEAMHRRVPTVAFTHDRVAPATIDKALAERNIFVWSGDFYAIEVIKALGLQDSGGVVRVGPVHYNSVDEIDSLLNALEDILS